MVEQTHVQQAENEGMLVQNGMAMGQALDREMCPLQCQGSSRQVCGVTDGEMMKLLWESKSQIEDLQMKIDHLIRKEME